MICFCVLAPTIDMFSKLAAQTVPVAETTAARYVAQAAFLLPVALAMRLSLRMDARDVWRSFLRAALSIVSTFTFVAAIRVMPLADALAIVFVEPFLLLMIGHVFLNERIGWRRLLAASIGFVGTVIVVRPSFAVFGTVAFYPLGTALFFSLYMLSTRQARAMHPVSLQATTALTATVLSVPLVWLAPRLGLGETVMPEGIAWVWLAGIGLGSSASHILLSYALRFASSTVLAPLHYLELVSATVIGRVVFGDFPDRVTWIGIAIIVASGLYVIHRERVTARAVVPVPFDSTT
jgi:drug/metabolite transporter (DMT)-like permease